MLLDQDRIRADEALLKLGNRLRADGYRFTCVTPATQARVDARDDAQQARTLRDVFGWSRPFAASLLSPDELEQLRLAGVQGAELSLRIVEQACERLSPGGTLLLYTGVAIVEGRDALLEAMRLRLAGPAFSWFYRELDPDVFGEQLLEPGYEQVERIAAVALTVTRRG